MRWGGNQIIFSSSMENLNHYFSIRSHQTVCAEQSFSTFSSGKTLGTAHVFQLSKFSFYFEVAAATKQFLVSSSIIEFITRRRKKLEQWGKLTTVSYAWSLPLQPRVPLFKSVSGLEFAQLSTPCLVSLEVIPFFQHSFYSFALICPLLWEEEGTPPPCQGIISPPSSSPVGVSSPRIPSSPPGMFLSAVFVPPF